MKSLLKETQKNSSQLSLKMLRHEEFAWLALVIRRALPCLARQVIWHFGLVQSDGSGRSEKRVEIIWEFVVNEMFFVFLQITLFKIRYCIKCNKLFEVLVWLVTKVHLLVSEKTNLVFLTVFSSSNLIMLRWTEKSLLSLKQFQVIKSSDRECSIRQM